MKIYIAGSYEDQVRLREVGDRIWKLGHVITSTWLQETKRPDDMPVEMFDRKLGIKDLCEISAADVVMFDLGRVTTGKAIEFGFALGQFQHKQLWLVGAPHSVFHQLADLEFEDWNEVFEFLTSQEEEEANAVG